MLQKTLAKTYMDTIANAAKSKSNVSNYLEDYDNMKKAYEESANKSKGDTTPSVVKTTGGKTYSRDELKSLY